MKEWIEELKKDKVNLMCDKYGSAVLKLIAEIEWVEKELAALKALHVTKRAVAMREVCEMARKHIKSYNAPTLKQLEHALARLDAVGKGEATSS